MTMDAATQGEIDRLYEAGDAFAGTMKVRLREQAPG
jgi:hypothetical protein